MGSPRGLVGVIALTLREILSDLRQQRHAEQRVHNECDKEPLPVVTVLSEYIYYLRSVGVTYSVKLPDSRLHFQPSRVDNEM